MEALQYIKLRVSKSTKVTSSLGPHTPALETALVPLMSTPTLYPNIVPSTAAYGLSLRRGYERSLSNARAITDVCTCWQVPRSFTFKPPLQEWTHLLWPSWVQQGGATFVQRYLFQIRCGPLAVVCFQVGWEALQCLGTTYQTQRRAWLSKCPFSG